MSQQNVEIVRRGIEYAIRTDEHPWDLIDPEVEIYDHDVPDASVYRGHGGWREWESLFDGAWESVTTEPEEYIEAGEDRVVAVLRLTAVGRGGITLERRDAAVHTLRDGKIVRLDYYGSRAEALEAVGLEG
jgi:ketosteroid isomerase-like protein